MTTAGGYAVPAGVPRDIVMRLNAGINKALQSPTIAEKFAASGATIVGGTPEHYAETIRSETAKWAKVILRRQASNRSNAKIRKVGAGAGLTK